MKKFYIIALVFVCSMMSCVPGKYEYQDPGFVDMDRVVSIKMYANHNQLLANGKGKIEFRPVFEMEGGFYVAQDRVDYSQVEYYNASGELMANGYSTSDKNMIGKEIGVYAKIKGRDLLSDTVSFTVTDPAESESWKEITVPVIFHVLQTEDDIQYYGGELSTVFVEEALTKINHAFSGDLSTNPVGVDTKIRFKLALYDPYGSQLTEPGVNRYTIDVLQEEDGPDMLQKFIKSKQLIWDPERYMNIWLVSDRTGVAKSFFYRITRGCIPYFKNRDVTNDEIPGGLAGLINAPDTVAPPHTLGILYKLQSFHKRMFQFNYAEECDMTYALGLYFGLLRTWDDMGFPGDDYCSDTFRYGPGGSSVNDYNRSTYKISDDYFFLAENIMDDPVAPHRSISQEQAKRIRWVLNNCPGRYAWKSNFALTGYR